MGAIGTAPESNGKPVPLWKVYLGADYDTRDLFNPTEVGNLVMYDLDHVEGISRGDRVDENKTMDPNGML